MTILISNSLYKLPGEEGFLKRNKGKILAGLTGLALIAVTLEGYSGFRENKELKQEYNSLPIEYVMPNKNQGAIAFTGAKVDKVKFPYATMRLKDLLDNNPGIKSDLEGNPILQDKEYARRVDTNYLANTELDLDEEPIPYSK